MSGNYLSVIWRCTVYCHKRGKDNRYFLCCAGSRSFVYISGLHFLTNIGFVALDRHWGEALKNTEPSHTLWTVWKSNLSPSQIKSTAALNNFNKLSTGLYRQPRETGRSHFSCHVTIHPLTANEIVINTWESPQIVTNIPLKRFESKKCSVFFFLKVVKLIKSLSV